MAEASNPHYVVRFKLVPEAAPTVDALDALIRHWKEMWEALGGSVTIFELTLGDHDAVLFGSMESDEKVAAFGVAVCLEGGATTSSARAFTPEEALQLEAYARGVHK